MQISQKTFKLMDNKRGTTAVVVAIVLTVLIGIAALAVDVGYLYATRNELQNVSDAAALAGAGYLGSVYSTLSYQAQQTFVFNRASVVSVVQQVALKNRAAEANIVINDSDVVIGTWNGSTVQPTLTSPDAVQVTARRDGNANTPVATFFARIWGKNTVDITTDATAALTGPATVDDGELKTPFSLSELNFPNNCSDQIMFSPTTESCAGWHNFFDPINANKMNDKLLGFVKGDGQDPETNPCLLEPCGQAWLDANFDMNKEPTPAVTPEASTGDEFYHQGGTIASLFNGAVIMNPTMDTGSPIDGNPKFPAPLPALFHYFKRRDGDGDNNKWTATIPIYKDGETCGNPHGLMEIVGFARIEVFMPQPPPDKTISVNVDCNQSFITGRGGGGQFGNLKGNIPNLVE
jgi:Flp pilus assembly protein TadG